MLYLVKADDSLISHCRCESTPIGAPAQMDCPWCGCGWLFLCPKCRKAFTFAKAVETDLTWEELAHRDLDGKWGKAPSADDVREWIGFMKILLKDIQFGKRYVFIDGGVFSADEKNFSFEGWYASHEFQAPPQVAGPPALDETLGNQEYWRARRLPE